MNNPSPPGKCCKHRLFEWIAGCMMLGIWVTLVASPNSIAHSTFHPMLEIGLNQFEIGLIFLVAGMLRIGALVANGKLPVYGPLVRALTALAAAVFWGQLMVALYSASRVGGTISPGVPVYFFLVIGELVSCYRAVRDGYTSSR